MFGKKSFSQKYNLVNLKLSSKNKTIFQQAVEFFGRDERVSKKDIDGRGPSTSRKAQSGRRQPLENLSIVNVDGRRRPR